MLTQGLFATSNSIKSPVFEGFHDSDQRSDAWATPRFGPDQVNRIIDWVMSSPDEDEFMGWAGNAVLHHIGAAEAGRKDAIHPDVDGLYGIGWSSWPWIEVSSPEQTHPEKPAAGARLSIGSAPAMRRTGSGSGSGDTDRASGPLLDDTATERVHHIGWRTIAVRASARGCSGFDVFAGGQRLTHADPFAIEPTSDQVCSFLSMRKRGLDLLMAEQGAHDRDLYALLHGTQGCPRYAAIARNDRCTRISLHEDLDAAVHYLRDCAARDTRSWILGVQDLDGPFLPAHVAVTLCSPEPTQAPRQEGGNALNPYSAPSQAVRNAVPGGHHNSPCTHVDGNLRAGQDGFGRDQVNPLDTPTSPAVRHPAGTCAPQRSASRHHGHTPAGSTAAVIIRPSGHGRSTDTGRRQPGRHSMHRSESVHAPGQLVSRAVDNTADLVRGLGTGLVAVSTIIALVMSTSGPARPRRLPPRHRAAGSGGFLGGLLEHPGQAARRAARHLSNMVTGAPFPALGSSQRTAQPRPGEQVPPAAWAGAQQCRWVLDDGDPAAHLPILSWQHATSSPRGRTFCQRGCGCLCGLGCSRERANARSEIDW